MDPEYLCVAGFVIPVELLKDISHGVEDSDPQPTIVNPIDVTFDVDMEQQNPER